MYAPTQQTTPSRLAERARYDAGTVHAILDEALIGHLAFEADGRPQVLPMLFVRVGETVYLHGSTGQHAARASARRKGIDVAFEVTLIDALVLARSAFHHSANYRSVVVHGTATVVREGELKASVLDALVDKLVPGRAADARPGSVDELRQTAVLALPLAQVSAKVRTGGPIDDEEDRSRPTWAGIVPVSSVLGEPLPVSDLATGIAVPDYL